MRRTSLSTTVIAAGLLLAACSGSDAAQGLDAPRVTLDERPTATSTDPVAEPNNPDPSPDTSSPVDDADTTPAEEELALVATGTFRTTGVEDMPVELTIAVNEFRRAGNIVNLRFQLVNNGPNDYRPSIHLSDGALGTSADAISLIDYDSDLRYLTVVDENGQCVCTDFSFSDLKPGATISITAAFPAPPDASVLDIQLGDLGTLSDVPLAS